MSDLVQGLSLLAALYHLFEGRISENKIYHPATSLCDIWQILDALQML